MSSAQSLIASLPARYVPRRIDRTITYYFSVGDEKHTLVLSPESCQVKAGKPEHADCVVKADPDVFMKLVVHGKTPGPVDIMRGRFKTSDVELLTKLKDCFRF